MTSSPLHIHDVAQWPNTQKSTISNVFEIANVYGNYSLTFYGILDLLLIYCGIE